MNIMKEAWLKALKDKYPTANVLDNGAHITAVFNSEYVAIFNIAGNFGWVD